MYALATIIFFVILALLILTNLVDSDPNTEQRSADAAKSSRGRKIAIGSISTVLAVILIVVLVSSGPQTLTLNVYNWGEYISDGSDDSLDTIKAFEQWYYETYGVKVKVNYSTYASNEDMYAKLSSGAVSFDVVIPSDYMIARMASERYALRSTLTTFRTISNSRRRGEAHGEARRHGARPRGGGAAAASARATAVAGGAGGGEGTAGRGRRRGGGLGSSLARFIGFGTTHGRSPCVGLCISITFPSQNSDPTKERTYGLQKVLFECRRRVIRSVLHDPRRATVRARHETAYFVSHRSILVNSNRYDDPIVRFYRALNPCRQGSSNQHAPAKLAHRQAAEEIST